MDFPTNKPIDPSLIVWQPQPGPQTALLAAGNIFDVFFGGARGGGKSDGMLGEWIAHANKYGEAARGIFIRRAREELTQLITRAKQLYLPLGARWLESKKTFTFPNKATLRFHYLKNENDASGFLGHQYTRVFIEELTTFASPDAVYKLMACLRSPHGVPCGFRATANPGGVGHAWVKERYIKLGGNRITKQIFENPITGEKIVSERLFIPSVLKDNRYLFGPDYVRSLLNLQSPTLVKAWLEGNWDIMEGAFFPEFSMLKHVIPPFPIPDHWTRFRAMDLGSAKPFSVGWYAIVPHDYAVARYGQPTYAPLPMEGQPFVPPVFQPLILPRGALVRYREWYGIARTQEGVYRPDLGIRLDSTKIADEIWRLESGEPRNSEGRIDINYAVIDRSAFKSENGPSVAETLNKRLSALGTTSFRRGDNKMDRNRGPFGGNDQIRWRLTGDGRTPMLFLLGPPVDGGPNFHLIRTIQNLPHDPLNPERHDPKAEDHAVDELRYACMSRPWIRPDQAKEDGRRLLGDMTLDDLWNDFDQKRKNSNARIH